MATAKQIVQLALSQVGVKESPANSNLTKYGKWYGMNGQPWCDMFVSWCADQIGQTDIGKFAYCPYHVTYFKNKGMWLGRTSDTRPGDIVFFAQYDKSAGGIVACHVGIVIEKLSNTSVRTVEGNTSVTSNDNGGAVMIRDRSYGTVGNNWHIMGFARPDYANEGWVYDGTGWWWQYEDGSWPYSCWKKINNVWYWFNKDGYAASSEWVVWENHWYYLKKNCDMAEGWTFVNGHWYYLNPGNGDMKEGWYEEAGKHYYLEPGSGIMLASAARSINSKWYAFDNQGRMFTKMTDEGALSVA